ncbi:YifB family Mg chelatase-like AAA ATPase [bacterium]|nr:YifB family Mg chelatase-like AAA ATPase [bacterium]
MIGHCESAVLFGAEGVPIQVEAITRPGKPRIQIIGLGDGAVREARDRLTAALHAADFEVPDQILINLAPADMKKAGSGLELAMAWAVLTASRQVESLASTWLFGELSLDGELKPIRGVAGLVSCAALHGIQRVILPIENEREALLVDGIEVIGVASLSDLRSVVASGPTPLSRDQPEESEEYEHQGFEDVFGQEAPKRAFEIAAAGGHNLLLVGPPGCGKSMLAERFSSLLPPLERAERLEIAQIASAIGEPIDEYLRGRRPFRAPHHIVSDVGLIGGGANLRPGEVSLAHGGVLFLDEFPEFQRRTLESLRAPLETRRVTITRAVGTTTYPASFQLVAAMNPCPCGRFGMKDRRCRCSRHEVARYLKKISQPILERIDLHVEAEPVNVQHFDREQEGEVLIGVERERRKRVRDAIHIQQHRQKKRNGELSLQELQPFLAKESSVTFDTLSGKGELSARSAIRLLRMSRTIADLERSERIEEHHLMEAWSFRALERIWEYVEAT